MSLMQTTFVPATPRLGRALPVVFVSNVEASATFYRDTLGFVVEFLHGDPPFYGSVTRGAARIHLKFVHEPVLTVGPEDKEGFISVFIEVEHVESLYAEYVAAAAAFNQPLETQAWGGRDFIVRDPDGNGICFAELPA